MSDDNHILKTSGLTRARSFALKPDADMRSGLAGTLGISGIRKLAFEGEIAPDGARDLKLIAKLGATVVQECVVTGAPVVTRIDEPVVRRYLADMPEPDAEEMEMPEDETAEPMPAAVDLETVMAEALALALPDWPRAEGVDPVDISVTEPGKTPISDEDVKPFAALKSLRDQLNNGDVDEG